MSNWPLRQPEKATVLPSGEKAGPVCCSMSSMSMTSRTPPFSTSTSSRLRPLSRLAKTASVLPSGENERSRPSSRPVISSWAIRYW